MPRPRCCRRVAIAPRVLRFCPESESSTREVLLGLDELEAIRLADAEGLYHAAAAVKMQVSRQTFGRTLASAHRKVAIALVEGCTLRVVPSEEGSTECTSACVRRSGRNEADGAGCNCHRCKRGVAVTVTKGEKS